MKELSKNDTCCPNIDPSTIVFLHQDKFRSPIKPCGHVACQLAIQIASHFPSLLEHLSDLGSLQFSDIDWIGFYLLIGTVHISWLGRLLLLELRVFCISNGSHLKLKVGLATALASLGRLLDRLLHSLSLSRCLHFNVGRLNNFWLSLLRRQPE